MNDLTKPAATGVSSSLLDRLRSGIAESRASTVIAGGKPFMRLLRDGVWVFGQNNEEVQEGSLWAINPISIRHGWVCWARNEAKARLIGETMTAVHEPKPPKPANAPSGEEYAEQRSFEMKCLNGDDAGTEVIYKINSVGGMRAVDELLHNLQGRLAIDQTYFCPVVELLVDSYPHSAYGKIYTPVLRIEAWCDMNGQLAGAEPEQIPFDPPVATPAPAPAKRARKAPIGAAPAATPAPAPAEPAPTSARTPGPVRRRPAVS